METQKTPRICLEEIIVKWNKPYLDLIEDQEDLTPINFKYKNQTYYTMPKAAYLDLLDWNK